MLSQVTALAKEMVIMKSATLARAKPYLMTRWLENWTRILALENNG
jgi:hypothetical protein